MVSVHTLAEVCRTTGVEFGHATIRIEETDLFSFALQVLSGDCWGPIGRAVAG